MLYAHLLTPYVPAAQSAASIPLILIGLLILATLTAKTITLNIGPLKITLRKPGRRRKRRPGR